MFWGFFAPIGLDGIFLTEMYLTHEWKVDNISIWTIYHCKHKFIGFLKISSISRLKLGLQEICKNVTVTMDCLPLQAELHIQLNCLWAGSVGYSHDDQLDGM